MRIGVYEPVLKDGYSPTGVAIPTESGIIGCMTICRSEQVVGTRSSSTVVYGTPIARVEARKFRAESRKRVKTLKRTGLNVQSFNAGRKPVPA